MTAREYLHQMRTIKYQIKVKKLELRDLREDMETLHSPSYGDKVQGGRRSRFEDQIIKAIHIEEDIRISTAQKIQITVDLNRNFLGSCIIFAPALLEAFSFGDLLIKGLLGLLFSQLLAHPLISLLVIGHKWKIIIFNGLSAYITLMEAGARVFVQDLDENGTTVIKELNLATGEAYAVDGWYTLNGVKLQGAPTEKGIYINNGKKVVIK